MKPRNAEAARLEEDYLARIRAALTQSGRSPAEASEVVESVREHIREASETLAEPEISLSAMAAIIEQLGPPEAYIEADPTNATPASSPTLAASFASSFPPPPLPSAGNPTYPSGPFTFGRVFGDAVTLYTQNFLPLLLASVIFYLLSICTLLILLGPLSGGAALMTLKAINRPDHIIDVADLFGVFNQFWPLLWLTLLTVVCIFVGMVMGLVPGLILTALWFLPYYFMVEKRLGVIASLRASVSTVLLPGNFLTTFLLGLAIWAITLVGASIPYFDIVLLWVVMPLFWYIETLTYVHQTRNARAPANTALSRSPA